MTFEVNGKPDLSVVIRLAPDEAEYWVFKDVSAFKGKTIKITYDGNEKGLSKIYQSDEIEGQAELYKEKNRPQFHFTTRRGWINDPNGLIYYEANTTCSTSTILSKETGRICTGAMRSART